MDNRPEKNWPGGTLSLGTLRRMLPRLPGRAHDRLDTAIEEPSALSEARADAMATWADDGGHAAGDCLAPRRAART